jgi:signal transduction histidine kinase
MKFFARQLPILGLALGLWALLVAIFTLQFALIGSFSLGDAFQQAISPWGAWFIFMPVVVWLSLRFPFETGRLARWLCVHLVACAVIVAISQGVQRYSMSRWRPSPAKNDSSKDKGPTGPELAFVKGMLSFRGGLDVLLYCSVVGICQGITSFRRSQLRERRSAELEARLSQSQLHALRMQINPHFLFNTLNAISTLIYVNPRAADEMIADLSALLRRSLDTAERQETSLSEEIQFIRAYIAIEQKRFAERLQVNINIPDDLSDALVPCLILQPLVENAIRHGIEPLRAPGLISIQAKRHGPRLILTVQDNGKGPSPSPSPDSSASGVGLPNTQARLLALYGANHQFLFTAANPRGCLVEIHLPFHTQPVEPLLA